MPDISPQLYSVLVVILEVAKVVAAKSSNTVDDRLIGIFEKLLDSFRPDKTEALDPATAILVGAKLKELGCDCDNCDG